MTTQKITLIKKELVSILGEDMVRVNKVNKNNDITLTGFTIGNGNICLTFYAENYDSSLKAKEIARQIVEHYESSAKMEIPNIGDIITHNGILENVCPRLVSTKLNADTLQNFPHKNVTDDLAIIYAVNVIENETVKVTNELADKCELSENELYNAAMENVMKLNPPTESSMLDTLMEMLNCTREELEMQMGAIPDDMKQIIVTNKEKLLGAVSIFIPEFLEYIHNKYGNFVMLPSSMHEVIIIPSSEMPDDMEFYDDMVREVNETQVAKVEWLSDHAYYYDGEWK